MSEFIDIMSSTLFDKSASNFFVNLLKDVVKQRQSENIVKKDFLNSLIQLLEDGVVEDDDGNKNKTKKGN